MRKVFITTQNVHNFLTAMKAVEKDYEDPAFLVFYGPAGRGKSDAAKTLAALEGWTYCRVNKGWEKSDLWMLQDICFELKVEPIPKRKRPCFEAIVKTLSVSARTVIIDDADKIPQNSLDWIRDFTDLTDTPFALVGEKLILHKMKHEQRLWSRTVKFMEFGPITAKDIMFFAKEATKEEKRDGFHGVSLTANQAEIIRQTSEGDFRPVKRTVFHLERIIRANPALNERSITDDMVRLAIKQGLKGKDAGSK